MTRHGYCDDLEHPGYAMWRGRVMSAIRGKRGQRFLRDLRDALDAMPDKRLFRGAFFTEDGGCCALGAALRHRGVEVSGLVEVDPDDQYELNDEVAHALDIAECLAREVEYENDDVPRKPEELWAYMRAWADKHISALADEEDE